MSLTPAASRRSRAILLSLLGSLVAPAAFGQAHSEAVAIPGEALPAQAEAALEEGLELESLRRWADAVAHYEHALRDFPNDHRLERRFKIVRLHTSLERRYADASFLETVASLDSRAALDLHAELLAKIESHYVVTPPWTELTRNGALALLIAAREPAFLERHGIRPGSERVESFRRELGAKLTEAGEVRNAREALRWASELSRLGEMRLGAPAPAWTLEFVAAAAGGLDNYSAFLTPGQLRDVYAQIEGNFVGLGVELKADDGALLIVRVIPGSPAARAGMKAGDRITAVDGQQTAELSTDEAAALLTGEEGSFAFVTVTSPAAPLGGVGRPRVPCLEADREPGRPAYAACPPRARRGSEHRGRPDRGRRLRGRLPPHPGVPEVDRSRRRDGPLGPASSGDAHPGDRPAWQPGRPADLGGRAGRQVRRRRQPGQHPRPQRGRGLRLPGAPGRHVASATGRADRRRLGLG